MKYGAMVHWVEKNAETRPFNSDGEKDGNWNYIHRAKVVSLLHKICEKEMSGIVKARKCDECGHHEIVVLTESGEEIPLRPGMEVKLKKIPL